MINKINIWKCMTALTASSLLCAGLVSSGVAWSDPGNGQGYKGDDWPHPKGQKQRELRQKGLQAKLKGNARGKTHEVAKGQYVELERTGEDSIFSILVDYSNFPRNNIEEPDRSVNNTTIWTDDFSRDHYMELLFSEEPGAVSVRNFYIELSSNRYTVNGDVTDWVTAPGTAESYDDDLGAFALWQLLIDSGQGWYDAQISSGMSPDDINGYLSQFDVWDRYDHDGDGIFDEPDGYIDHFQSIHAGEGEEAGGGALGGAAIWSHRWYAYFNLIGIAGPAGNLAGGVQVGQSDYWIGDYTIEPENGGVGVFAHEFAHDLGLPDLYATAGGENGTGFWTLMSSGSWLGDGTEDIGSRPGHMGAWEKFQLGWLNYEVAFAGSKSEHKLGPAHANTKQAQGLFVVLPDKEVSQDLGAPYAGDKFYYSGSGDNLDNRMGKGVNLAPGSSLSAQVNFDIEYAWDFVFFAVSTDGGVTYQTVPTNLSTPDDLAGVNPDGHGISGSTGGTWVELTADLSAFTGPVIAGFAYITDGAVAHTGFMADEVTIGDVGPDGAEEDPPGMILNGFTVTTGTETQYFFNAYVGEFRQYSGYDRGLSEGPYNFGFTDNPELGDWVEHFPYQDGLLMSYWDTSESDNNTGIHPGSGLILPIDAHPTPLLDGFGSVWRGRVQTYDATFGKEPTDAIKLHRFSTPSEHPSLPAESVFDDRNSYWDPLAWRSSVIVPNTGTQVRVKSISAKDSFMQVEVRPAK